MSAPRPDAEFELLHSDLSGVVPIAIAVFVAGVVLIVAAHLGAPHLIEAFGTERGRGAPAQTSPGMGALVVGVFVLFVVIVASLAAIRRFGERREAQACPPGDIETAAH